MRRLGALASAVAYGVRALAWLSARAIGAAPGALLRGGRRSVTWARRHPLDAVLVGAGMFASWAVYDIASMRADKAFAEDLECLALNIYHEARGEPVDAQLAVAMVVTNRAAHPRFPDRVCDVVRQGAEWPLNRCQFSWWCDGRSDAASDPAAMARSRALAAEVLRGKHDDPTDGSLWYHALGVTPAWSAEFARGPTIGSHIFYRLPAGS